MAESRRARVERRTSETSIYLELVLDGQGVSEISTGIPFLDHMLSLMARHGMLDMRLEALGDLEVDQHHTVEDIGLTLGRAIKEALGDKAGINRYGWCLLPMDESLCLTALDMSGRPHLTYRAELPGHLISDYDPSTLEEFLKALVNEGGITLHLQVLAGENPHHVIESIFKALGRALRMAVEPDPRNGAIPSTKGTL